MSHGDYDEMDRAVAAAFGRQDAAADPRMIAAFREAGFSEDQANEGARLMESGLYFGFADVANTIMRGPGMSFYDAGNKPIAPNVTPYSIAEVAKKLTGQREILERRTATQTRPRLVESATATRVGEAVFEACLIDVGQGSSGYYPASTLQEAAGSKVFRAGTQCYIDHPTQSETYERPERSLKDLAGALETDAVFRDNGLWSRVRVFSSHRDFITERASTIGLSIRADGEVDGTTVTKLTRVHSVDFVTRAGRGGRLVV